MADVNDAPVGICTARRAVLASLATAGVVAVAGCGSDYSSDPSAAGNYDTSTAKPKQPGGQGGGQGGGTGTGTGTKPSGSAKPTGSAKPSKPSTGAPPANALVKTDKVPVGGGMRVGNTLVVQPQSGVFRAFDATCPHAGVPVDAPEGGVATCPAHGSTFKASDGSKISGPTPRGLSQIAVKVQSGYVVKA